MEPAKVSLHTILLLKNPEFLRESFNMVSELMSDTIISNGNVLNVKVGVFIGIKKYLISSSPRYTV